MGGSIGASHSDERCRWVCLSTSRCSEPWAQELFWTGLDQPLHPSCFQLWTHLPSSSERTEALNRSCSSVWGKIPLCPQKRYAVHGEVTPLASAYSCCTTHAPKPTTVMQSCPLLCTVTVCLQWQQD